MVIELVAIAISLAALVGFFLTRETIVRVQCDLLLAEAATDRLKQELIRLEAKIPKELYSDTLEPGVYLPKQNNETGEMEYQKASDAASWGHVLKEMTNV